MPAAPKPVSEAVSRHMTEARAALPAMMKHLCELAESARREDLIRSLEATKRRSAETAIRVSFVGLRRKGKSHLINSLITSDVCAVGEAGGTKVVTVIRHAEVPSARLLVEQPGEAEPRTLPLPLTELSSDLAASSYADGRTVIAADIGVKSSILAANLALTDTPGFGGRGQPHSVHVLNEVAASDAAVFVTDASQEFTQPELRFLRNVRELCPTTVIAMTKTDLYPDWRRIVDADESHLARSGLECRIIPLSSTLRGHAVRLGDKSLNSESGFPELMQFLRTGVLADASTRRIARVISDFDTIAQHLTLPLEAELNAMRDPEFRERMTSELKSRKELSDSRAKTASLWQQTLADGIADLTAEVDHDLKHRMRLIGKEAEVLINESDPDKKWPQLTDWVHEQVGNAVADNFVWAFESAQALAEKVATSFAEDGERLDLPALDAICGGVVIDPELTVGRLSASKASTLQKVLVAVRGGYSGSMMVGMGTQMAFGMASMNPIALGAGVLLGGQSYREDRNNRLTRRRAEAQANVRKYIDEISFHVGKLSRDRLRNVQRILRDHFRSIAEQEIASLQESVKAAHDAANLELGEREKKAAAAEKKLAVLKKCREQASRLRVAGVVPASR
ncbi:dynamin family protein [Mycolicibacterium litorale]|uniref:dynamin family protein n=1 Tax=Mycolicibacterium litorale TaxID=758802 RepID=UPI0013D25E9C|nr:dynamin family protein [Mycolicibacterium litorale]MCV7413714.1 dynamin family protein [Mycolicibacterium litorale]